jgi:hypothetical protein
MRGIEETFFCPAGKTKLTETKLNHKPARHLASERQTV